MCPYLGGSRDSLAYPRGKSALLSWAVSAFLMAGVVPVARMVFPLKATQCHFSGQVGALEDTCSQEGAP